MHIDIQAKLPVTVALASDDQWQARLQNPGAPPHLDFICMRDHIVNTTFEGLLPDGRSMVLLIHGERTPDRARVQSIVAVFGHGARSFIAPDDLKITYYRLGLRAELHTARAWLVGAGERKIRNVHRRRKSLAC
jgi:hypothetical protein